MSATAAALAPAAQAGHWLVPDRAPGTPGLFALIIGVSDYTHLAGGSGPPAQLNYGLGQLSVSALTGLRFFDWLREGYRIDDCPLAEAWCLLAPTAKETAFEPRVAEHAWVPTLAACSAALAQWYGALRKLPRAAAERSRAVFFFSGHGVEVYQGQQILLPRDWLSPPAEGVNGALSTQNLVRGLAALQVPRQFFFIDACRNDNQDLRSQRVEGALILNEPGAAQCNPDVIAPILYATASGQESYQQPDPGKGLSLYGTALIEGLKATPDIELRQVDAQWAVTLFPLQAYVKARIAALLRTSPLLRQPVKLGGTSDDQTVTLAPPPLPGGKPRLAGGLASGLMGRRVETARAVPLTRSLELRGDQQAGWVADDGVGHGVFGAETVTELWRSVRVTALGSGETHGADVLEILRVSRSPDTRLYRIEFSIAAIDSAGYLLELYDGMQTTGVVLPPDPGPLGYRIEFAFAYALADGSAGRHITRLEAEFALGRLPLAQPAATLWNAYANGDAQSAMALLDDEAFKAHLFDAMLREHALSEPILALVALRAGQWDRVQNLFDRCPAGDADMAICNAVHALLARPRGDVALAVHKLLARLEQGPLPRLSETIGLVAQYASQWMELGAEDDVLRLHALKQRADDALVYLRPDGLFAVYRGYPDAAVLLAWHVRLEGALTGDSAAAGGATMEA